MPETPKRPKKTDPETQINGKLLEKDYPKELAPVLSFLLDEEEEVEEQIKTLEEMEARKDPITKEFVYANAQNLKILRVLKKSFSEGNYVPILAFFKHDLTIIDESIVELKEIATYLKRESKDKDVSLELNDLEIEEEEERRIRIVNLCHILEPFVEKK